MAIQFFEDGRSNRAFSSFGLKSPPSIVFGPPIYDDI